MSRFSAAVVLCAVLVAPRLGAQAPAKPSDARPDPLAALDTAIAAAEASLRNGELQIAESRYRSALLEGWMAAGALHVASGRFPQGRAAFRHATTSAVDAGAAFRSLALVHLQMGEPAEAVAILTKIAGREGQNSDARRLLAQALLANRQPEEAVQALEEAHGAAPDDPEVAFLLASAYLHVKKIDAAERLFARVIAARPIPETHVLIGRTYRDFKLLDRARAALEQALKKDPRTRRAHYYLGTIAVMDEGILRLDEAIREFRAELKLAPKDPLTNLKLGMALVEARRPAEALPPLEIATGRSGTTEYGAAPADAFLYLGRCQLALDRPADAVASLRRALDLAQAPPVDQLRVRNAHYQLALALRRSGNDDEAAAHFEQAERASARRADVEREQLGRYLADAPDPEGTGAPVIPVESPFTALSPSARADLERRVTEALARAYLNLGIMHAQAQRFTRAAEFLAQAAEVSPEFPQVQYSLGVAYFNAQQYDKATAPLARAVAADPANVDISRMLALASLNSGNFAKAAELLASDPRRESDPSLQYAYGLALVREGRAKDAEVVFTRLLDAHGTTPELMVLMGQAHAQQGDYESAIQMLQRALNRKSDVAEANATLGLIYLKQGKLPEARTALRVELAAHPDDLNAAHTLATVLDLEGDQAEAVAILRGVLKKRPDYADARYLLGKILLASGEADEAVTHLEAGARLAPEDANIHYQLSQAYRKLGRMDLADRQLEVYQQLKDKRRVP